MLSGLVTIKKDLNEELKQNYFLMSLLRIGKLKPNIQKSDVRYTKAGFEPLTETIIRNNKIGIIIWTEKTIGDNYLPKRSR